MTWVGDLKRRGRGVQTPLGFKPHEFRRKPEHAWFSAGLPNSHKNYILPQIGPIKAVLFRFSQLLVTVSSALYS